MEIFFAICLILILLLPVPACHHPFGDDSDGHF